MTKQRDKLPARADLARNDNGGDLLLYQSEDGASRIEVRLVGETLWLTQNQMAELFQTTPQNITLHLKRLYKDGELDEAATCKKYLQVQTEAARQVRRSLKHYNLDAIISVGYRVNSLRGTQFRIWATERLREYLVKGFAMDDQRLKEAGGGSYFDELLARIRDIRSSEKVFWRKVLPFFCQSEIDIRNSSMTRGRLVLCSWLRSFAPLPKKPVCCGVPKFGPGIRRMPADIKAALRQPKVWPLATRRHLLYIGINRYQQRGNSRVDAGRDAG